MSLYLGTNLISGVATPIEGARNIGQIVQSTIPLTDAGLHLLDGALIQGSGSYADFVDYIASIVSGTPDIFTTESNWQQSVTDYGVCGKFVYDSVNNTVRLPKITGFTEATIDPTVLGDLTEAGLPNIMGKFSVDTYINTSEGAFYQVGGLRGPAASVSFGTYNIGETYIDASRSNSIYGNSSTVQPQAIKVLYYIVIATSTKTQIEVDIDEIATDLNGKADVDLSNINPTQTIKNTIIDWGKPDYTAGVELNINTPSTFDAYWYGYHNGNYCDWTIVLPTGETITLAATLSAGLASSCCMFIPKGSYYTYSYNNWKPVLYPLKGQ